jgi:hypothetical protein
MKATPNALEAYQDSLRVQVAEGAQRLRSYLDTLRYLLEVYDQSLKTGTLPN